MRHRLAPIRVAALLRHRNPLHNLLQLLLDVSVIVDYHITLTCLELLRLELGPFGRRVHGQVRYPGNTGWQVLTVEDRRRIACYIYSAGTFSIGTSSQVFLS